MTAQRLLFDELPETEPVRKPRRSRATTVAAPVAVDVVREAVPAPHPTFGSATFGADSPKPAGAPATFALALVPPVPAPAPLPPAFEPESLTNPELRTLVQAVPDQRLAYLLIEAARELRRRVAPDRDDDAADDESAAGGPNPALLRAARQVVGELSGED